MQPETRSALVAPTLPACTQHPRRQLRERGAYPSKDRRKTRPNEASWVNLAPTDTKRSPTRIGETPLTVSEAQTSLQPQVIDTHDFASHAVSPFPSAPGDVIREAGPPVQALAA